MLPLSIYSILPFSLRPSSSCLRLLPCLPSLQSYLLPFFQQSTLSGGSYARCDQYSWPLFALLCAGSSCPSWPLRYAPWPSRQKQQKLLCKGHKHSAVISADSSQQDTNIFLQYYNISYYERSWSSNRTRRFGKTQCRQDVCLWNVRMLHPHRIWECYWRSSQSARMESMYIETRPHGISYLLSVLESVRQKQEQGQAGSHISALRNVRTLTDISFGFVLQQMK